MSEKTFTEVGESMNLDLEVYEVITGSVIDKMDDIYKMNGIVNIFVIKL